VFQNLSENERIVESREIGVFTLAEEANCVFTFFFCNFVILPSHFKNEASICPYFECFLSVPLLNEFKR